MPAAPSSVDQALNHPSTLRTLVNLGLFIHFFGVALALVSYTAASPLESRVLEVLPYLRTLDFDLIHNYASPARLQQTHGLESDVDFSCVVTATRPDGGSTTMTLPPADVWPAQRARRYRSLINVMGSLANNPEYDSALPKAVAGSVLTQLGAKRGEIRLRAHTLITMEDFSSPRESRRDPLSAEFYRTAYEAKVLAGKDGVSLLKNVAKGEVAPVERKPLQPGAAAPRPQKAKP